MSEKIDKTKVYTANNYGTGDGWSLVDENGSDADIGEADFKLVSYSAVQELLDALELARKTADDYNRSLKDNWMTRMENLEAVCEAALTKFREGKKNE